MGSLYHENYDDEPRIISINFKILIAVVITAIFMTGIFTAWAYVDKTPSAERAYKKAIEEESDAFNYYLLKKNTRCKKESTLARSKVLDYFSKARNFEEGEDINLLVEKAKWTCDIDLPNEDGNFKPSKGGISNFLEVNGAENVKGAEEAFEATGLLYDINPAMIVCIAQADSSLGKYIKTSNNIGNVGNNDRGSTWTPNTLNQGIAAIGQTLVNTWLGGYTQIGQLSNGGRTTLGLSPCGVDGAKCYATSSYNWNKNVKLCLRDILEDPTIDETYEFRTL